MKKIKVAYTDLWSNFTKENLFGPVLSKHYDVETVNDNNPNIDLLIYGPFGSRHNKINARKKVYWTGENRRINFNECDYAIGFDYIEQDNYLRYPLWRYYAELTNDLSFNTIEKKTTPKERFCAFTVSAANGLERNFFFDLLNEYKKVDSLGNLYNNNKDILRMSGVTAQEWRSNKINYLKKHNYKFAIVFENSSYPGYCTEKLPDAMASNVVPIYWGDAEVGKDFNEKSFINAHNFKTFQDLRDYIIEVDNNEDLYNQYYKEKYFTPEQQINFTNNDFEKFLLKIVESI